MKKVVAFFAEKMFYAIIDGMSLVGEGFCGIVDISRSMLLSATNADEGRGRSK